MKHPHGIHVQLRNEDDSWIEEYNGHQISAPVRVQGDYNGVCVTEGAGKQFRVKMWFRDFMVCMNGGKDGSGLDKDDGLAVIVSCGHGKSPPGGFEHVQNYWIKLDNLDTNHYRFCDYEVWKEDPQGLIKVDSIEYTMPAPAVIASAVGTDGTASKMNKGSVVVTVRRGKFLNKQGSLGNGTSTRSGSFPARIVTDPPDTRAYRATMPRKSKTLRHGRNDDPIVIAGHWFQAKDGRHGEPYVFEFKNLGTIDPVQAGLRMSPNSGEQDPDQKDCSDGSESAYDTADTGSEFDPTERRRRKDRKTKACKLQCDEGSAWLMGEDQDDEELLPDQKESLAQRTPVNATTGTASASAAVLTSEDQDDEELLPDRNETLDQPAPFKTTIGTASASTTQRLLAGLRRFVTTIKTENGLFGSSSRRSLNHELQATTVKLEKDMFHQHSSHPILQQEPDNEEASAMVEALDHLTSHMVGLGEVPGSIVGGEREELISDLQQQAEPSEGHSDIVQRASEEEDEIQVVATVRQQQPRTIIDLTMEDSDDDEGAEDEQAEIEAREARVKIARAARIEAEAEKEALDARQARDKKRRDREKKDRAQEKQRQADAARDRRIRKG
ncbi:hypothetical protein LTR17_006374 [Elasticomyces elasticus]|nr:hypothetical protein LTR17_006374 [Elasticomyces elasticus]